MEHLHHHPRDSRCHSLQGVSRPASNGAQEFQSITCQTSLSSLLGLFHSTRVSRLKVKFFLFVIVQHMILLYYITYHLLGHRNDQYTDQLELLQNLICLPG